MNVIRELEAVFGDYLAPERRQEWERTKALLKPGCMVTGRVVKQYHFGVFVDIGVQFPALLQVIQFEDAATVRYTDMRLYPEVGSTISARVVLPDDRTRQIALTQLARHPYLDASTRKEGTA